MLSNHFQAREWFGLIVTGNLTISLFVRKRESIYIALDTL